MKKFFSLFKSTGFLLFLILIIGCVVRIIYFFDNAIWWDTSVYIGMAKYIYSWGESGLWEASRPLVWPSILGFFSLFETNALYAGKVLQTFFSLGIVLTTFFIGKKVFNESTALLAALFVAVSPTLLFFNTVPMTAIPSTFFCVLGIFFLLKKKNLAAGFFIGLATMTRFLQVFVLLPLVLYVIYCYIRKKVEMKTVIPAVLSFLSGFLIITLPYLILNYFLYSNPIEPFLLQVFLTENTGWMYYQHWSYYFIYLAKENPLTIFVLSSFFYIFWNRKKREARQRLYLILALFLAFFLFFTSTPHKEGRFIITFLPYLYLLASFGFISAYKSFKKDKNIDIYSVLMVLLIFGWLIQTSTQMFPYQGKNLKTDSQRYLEIADEGKSIWISDPRIAFYSDKNANLLYYPAFTYRHINKLKTEIQLDDVLLMNTCDLLCKPGHEKCIMERPHFFNYLLENFNTVHYKKIGECEEYILSN